MTEDGGEEESLENFDDLVRFGRSWEEKTEPEDWYKYDPWKPDRRRGILTKADREYLCGESDLEPRSHGERRARERIRERTRHAILDFSILVRQLEERDREQIFTDDDVMMQFVRSAAPDLAGFLYQQLKTPEGYEDRSFCQAIESGVTNAIEREGWFSEVDVTLDIERTRRVEETPEETVEENLSQLSRPRLRQLLFAGVIDDEQFAEQVRKRDTDEEP